MKLVIDCECGTTVRGDGDGALIVAVETHIRDEHPAAIGAATRGDLLAMARPDREEDRGRAA